MEDHHADFWVAVAAAGPILLVAATVTINTKNLAPAPVCDAELLAGCPQLARGARTSPCIRTHLLRSSAPIMTSTTAPNHGYGVPPVEP
jgi:hypothetical protein